MDLGLSKPHRFPLTKYPKFPRETLSGYVRLVAGHDHSADYYRRFLSKALQTGEVSDKRNSIAHMLLACPLFTEHRHLLTEDESEGNYIILSKVSRKSSNSYISQVHFPATLDLSSTETTDPSPTANSWGLPHTSSRTSTRRVTDPLPHP
jgi:hypothetical protein